VRAGKEIKKKGRKKAREGGEKDNKREDGS